jgi:hypothetical protein
MVSSSSGVREKVSTLVKYGVRSSKFFGLHVHSCTHWQRPGNLPPPLPPPQFGRFRSAKMDDISLRPAGYTDYVQ